MAWKTSASLERTENELDSTMAKMKIQKGDYGWSVDNTNKVVIDFIKGANKYRIECNKFTSRKDNFRAAYLHIRNKRLDVERGVSSFEEAFKGYLQIEGPRERTPYEILGLPENAPLDVAEARFKDFAKIYHPDQAANQGPHMSQDFATQKFKEINEAIQKIRGR